MPEQVFINCLPEELPLLEGIEKRLELAGLSCYIPPAHPTPELQQELVEKISSIAAAHGCMVCILSNRAVSNSLFLSNIQLMCETSHTGRVLIYYQVERLENDQNIRLFSSQAYQVKKGSHPAADTAQIIQHIHQVLHPNSRNIFHFLSEHISRRVLSRLSIAALVLGVSGSILFNALQPVPVAIVLPTPTPAVLYVPFSGQSQDMGLTVDDDYVSDYIPTDDPAAEAPFAFKPEYILEQEDFSDPAFEHSYNGQKWLINNSRGDDLSSIAVNQANGVLELAMAPTGDQQLGLSMHSRYLFNLQQVTYLGYRIRLEDYQGRKTKDTALSGTFNFQYNDIADGRMIIIDGMSRRLFSDQSATNFGTGWHTVEMVSQMDHHFMDVYLDGDKINTLSLNETQLVRWTYYQFTLQVANTTDWVRFQIDEVIFGADQPILQTLLAENAPYRFIPDTITMHDDFAPQTTQQYLLKEVGFVTQTKSTLAFGIPVGKDSQKIILEFPTRPINESNYYAMRFRFTNPDNNPWVTWEGIILGLENKKFQNNELVNLSIGAFRRGYSFFGGFGSSNGVATFAFNQNAQPGNWHTLEMVIKPPSEGSQAYTIFYWVDGYLMGNRELLQDPARFMDVNAPLVATILISGEAYGQNAFSGEIDDLVIGFINSDRIKE